MSVAVGAITRLGLAVARKVSEGMGGDLFVPKRRYRLPATPELNCLQYNYEGGGADMENRYDSFCFRHGPWHREPHH